MIAASERALTWDGLVNGRDLGGLATAHGPVLPGRLLRTASVHTLTARGWEQLLSHGVSTIIDLRHQWEIDRATPERGLVPGSVHRQVHPLEPPGYVEEWVARGQQWKLRTPRFYAEFLEDHPTRVAAVLTAIADAPPGGVVVHCQGGRDRAGLVVAMVLRLLGADLDVITADHWASYDRDEPIEVALGEQVAPDGPLPDRASYAAVIADALGRFPPEGCFGDEATAANIRLRLATRLCGA
ncbi:MAG: tyrosine-protein phosphatase [Actinomycetota bacterium]